MTQPAYLAHEPAQVEGRRASGAWELEGVDPMAVQVPPQVLRMWRSLAGVEGVLQPGSVGVVRGSRGFCPTGWTGVLRLGDAIAIEAGNLDDVRLDLLRGLPDPSDPAALVAALSPAETLGPGELAYLPGGVQLAGSCASADPGVEDVDGREIAEWLRSLPPEDVDESSVDEMDRVMVLREGAEVLGAAGHTNWPEGIAHIGVLVAPQARGRGIGTRIGAAATRRALAAGLAPQWRAATPNAASRAAARRIGYVEVGRQLSFRVA